MDTTMDGKRKRFLHSSPLQAKRFPAEANYDKYFQEEIPEFPKEYESNFRIADKLLPGFRVSETLSFD